MIPLLLLGAALAREPALHPADFTGPPPLKPTATLESPQAAAAGAVGAGVTLHVILQALPKQVDGREVDTPESKRCREQAVSTVLHSGVRAVVAEGNALRGSLAAPQPIPPGTGPNIGAVLADYQGVQVYGFELPAVEERWRLRMTQMRDAAADLTALRTAPLDDRTKLARLESIQRDFYAAQTEFVVGAVPLRSFLALETALAVAAHRDLDEIFLILGSVHWPDIPHALQTADRLGSDRFVGLRILRYECR